MSGLKKCHIDSWYDTRAKKYKHSLNSNSISEREYRSSMRNLAWEYWERLERVDSGEK